MATTQLNRAEAITNLQQYLRKLSYMGTGEGTVPIDGIYDDATRAAVKNFQRDMGLSETGIVDKLTWDTLFAEYSEQTETQRGRRGLYFFPQNPRGYEVVPGNTLTLVRIIQLLLLELSVVYDIFDDIAESGTFDASTERAIREFQQINGLPPTGRVDERTWNRIVREYMNLSANSSQETA